MILGNCSKECHNSSQDCNLITVVSIASSISFTVAIVISMSLFYIYKRCRKKPQQQLPPVFVPNDEESDNAEAEEPCPRPDMSRHQFYTTESWVDTSRIGLPTLTSSLEDLTDNQEIQNTTESNCYDNAAIFKSREILQSDSSFVGGVRDWKVKQHLKIQKRRMEKREKTLQKLLAETNLQEYSFNTQPVVFHKKNPIANSRSCSCKHISMCPRKPRKQPSRC